MSNQDTAKCSSCGVILPKSELTWYDSEGGFYRSGFYCKQCLPSIKEEEDQLDSYDELETDTED